MSMGEILRTAREQRALSPSTAAEATHMKVQIIEDLEKEDFRRIAAPIYGRGFVKLYAEFLELDSAPLIREFMDLYSGKRAPVVGRRSVEATPAPPPAQEPTSTTRTVRSMVATKTMPLTRPQVRTVETEPVPQPLLSTPTPLQHAPVPAPQTPSHVPAPVSIPAPAPEHDTELDDDPLTLTPSLTPTHSRAIDPWVVEPEIPFADPNGEPDLFSQPTPQRQPVTTTAIVPMEPKTRKAPPMKRETGPIFDMGHRLDTSRIDDTPQDAQTTKRQSALLKTFTDSFKRFTATAFNKGRSGDYFQQYRMVLIAGVAFLVLCMLTGVILLFTMTSDPKKETTRHQFDQVSPIPNIYAD